MVEKLFENGEPWDIGFIVVLQMKRIIDQLSRFSLSTSSEFSNKAKRSEIDEQVTKNVPYFTLL